MKERVLDRNNYNPFCLSPEQIKNLEEMIPQVEWYFTDLRDGIQGASFSPSLENQKNVAELISHYISAVNGVLEGGYAGATQSEQEKFNFLKGRKINYSSFGSSIVSSKTPKEHFKPMLESQSKTCTIFVKCSLSQVNGVLKVSSEENLGLIKESIVLLKEEGKRVVVDMEHFFDGYYEENKEYGKKCIEVALEAGADVIVLCDTLGKTSPIKVEKCILDICDNEKSSDLAEKIKGKLGLHLHEDNYYTKESIIRALATGNVGHVQGNFGYAGERIGNSPLALLWVSLLENYNIDVFKNHPNREKIWGNLQITYTQVSKLLTGNFPTKVDSILNFRNYIHAAGMHFGALDKDEKSYSIISCKLKKLLQIENYPGLTGQAGKSNVNYYLEPSGLLDGLDNKEKNVLTNRILDFLKEPDALGYTGFLASFLLESYRIKEDKVEYLDDFTSEFLGIEGIKAEINLGKRKEHKTKVIVKMHNENYELEITEREDQLNGVFHEFVMILADKLKTKYDFIENLELLAYNSKAQTTSTDAKVVTKLVFRNKENGELFSVLSEDNNADIAGINAIKEAFSYFILCKEGKINHVQDKMLELQYGDIDWENELFFKD